jgi:hypothetical protein
VYDSVKERARSEKRGTAVKEKREKPDRKPNPLPYVLRNPYRKLKSEKSQD